MTAPIAKLFTVRLELLVLVKCAQIVPTLFECMNSMGFMSYGNQQLTCYQRPAWSDLARLSFLFFSAISVYPEP